MSKLTVLKFGGTSMGDEHTWKQVLDIIGRYRKPVVVVSATARTTRQLIKAAHTAASDIEQALSLGREIKARHLEITVNFLNRHAIKSASGIEEECKEWINRCLEQLHRYLQTVNQNKAATVEMLDAIASIGEQLSSQLLVLCGQACGLPMQWVDARSVIKTDSEFGKANPDIEKVRQAAAGLLGEAHSDYVPVLGGYYGEDTHGAITTLGFEGSDFTASLLGSVLQAKAIEIWTDVNGIYTCDPRVVKTARPVEELSFREATELAYFGAKVLHPSTMKPAAATNIPIFVKNIFEPDHPGTKIHAGAASNGLAKAMTFLNDICIITVSSSETLMGYRFLSEVFNILGDFRTPVDVVTTTEASVSVALADHSDLSGISKALAVFGTVDISPHQGLISLIGCAADSTKTIQQRLLQVVPGADVSMLSYNKAKKNFTVVLNNVRLPETVRAVHQSIFEIPANT